MPYDPTEKSVARSVIDRQADARLRILILGGGIAGLTLAALLEQRGEKPAVVERQGRDASGGYMLGMLPLGGRVLNGLGLHQAYLDASCPMRRYDFHDRKGRRIKSYSLDRIVENYGAYQGIERETLMGLLRQRISDDAIFYNTTVTALNEGETDVDVTFSDESSASFDVAVAADGLHSDTRLRTHLDHRNDQPRLRRMALGLRRRQDDDSAPRPPDPSLRHR